MIRNLCIVAGIALATVAAEAPAIIVSGGPGNPAPLNDTAPSDDPGWNRVGAFGNGSGVYLGNGWVLTANHVNNRNTFTLNGDTYAFVGGTGHRLTNPAELNLPGDSDLWLGQYAPNVGSDPLPAGILPIATTLPTVGTNGTMIGTGQTQTSQNPSTFYADINATPDWAWYTSPNADTDSEHRGFYTAGPRDQRWATSDVSSGSMIEDLGGAYQIGFYTVFLEELNGGMAALYDSGSGYFVKNGSTWELAGIAHAIATYSGQDDDLPGTAIYGNETFYGDLSEYRDQIHAITGIPEPATLTLLGVTAAVVGRRRPGVR